MEEQEILTMELVKSLMDKSYTLVWVDYNDNLDNCRDTIQKCLEERSCESLWEKVDEWYSDAEWEAVREIVSKLKDECIRFHDFGEEEVEEFFEEHEDEIREEIYDRNDADTLKELLKNTDDIPVRIEMLSNYDCINSNWLESQEGYRYKESYFGDMIDALNLNPAKVCWWRKATRYMAGFPTKNTGTARNRYPMNSSIRNSSTPAAVPTC